MHDLLNANANATHTTLNSSKSVSITDSLDMQPLSWKTVDNELSSEPSHLFKCEQCKVLRMQV